MSPCAMLSYDDSHSAKYDMKHTQTALQSYYNEEHLGTTIELLTNRAFSDGKSAQRPSRRRSNDVSQPTDACSTTWLKGMAWLVVSSYKER